MRRMRANPSLFSASDWERRDPDKHRKYIMERFNEFVDRFGWNHGERTDLKVFSPHPNFFPLLLSMFLESGNPGCPSDVAFNCTFHRKVLTF